MVSWACWAAFTKMNSESNQFRSNIFGFKCHRVKEHVWVDARTTAHCWTIVDSCMWSRHAGGYSWEQASMADWIKVTVKYVYPLQIAPMRQPPWDGGLSDSLYYKCQVERPRRSSWHTSYASYVGLVYDAWDINQLNMHITQVMADAVIKGGT